MTNKGDFWDLAWDGASFVADMFGLIFKGAFALIFLPFWFIGFLLSLEQRQPHD